MCVLEMRLVEIDAHPAPCSVRIVGSPCGLEKESVGYEQLVQGIVGIVLENSMNLDAWC